MRAIALFFLQHLFEPWGKPKGIQEFPACMREELDLVKHACGQGLWPSPVENRASFGYPSLEKVMLLSRHNET
jgi:hypothetical protein